MYTCFFRQQFSEKKIKVKRKNNKQTKILNKTNTNENNKSFFYKNTNKQMNIKGKWASSDNIKNKVKIILKSDIVCNNDLKL